MRLAADRRKWISFTPTVANAHALAGELRALGVSVEVVTGDTDKREREAHIATFRAGGLRCLVTVLALATGFDVPDVDCIVWCRPTKSPVLYVQGAGRGLRPAGGKTDCLWLDFSDTTERLGPVDAIRGRKKRKGPVDASAPYTVCDECGAHVRPASAMHCPECGAKLREDEVAKARAASDAAVLAHQLAQKIHTYEVTDVRYSRHQKAGAPDSLRVDYYAGLRRVASEWVCLSHPGFAGAKAAQWWQRRAPDGVVPTGTDQALAWIADGLELKRPAAIVVNESGRWPEIVKFEWSNDESNRTDADAHGAAIEA